MTRKSFQTILAAVACVGMICPPHALAASPGKAPKDVALRAGGVLVGQVVNQQGLAQADSAVSVRQNEREVVRTTTDANGIFAAQGLRGGQYEITTTDGRCFCRLWAADTAPPAASDAALIVTGDQIVRGQWDSPGYASYGGRWLDWVRSHPYITAGVVAAAIATPLAIAAANESDNPHS